MLNFTKILSTIALSIGLILFPFAPNAKQIYSEGQDYTILPKERHNNTSNKVQLFYFFSYGCPACARFDPNFKTWISEHKNKRLEIVKVPVVFNDQWQNLAKLYYVMQSLDPKEDLHTKIFVAIHEKNMSLWQESEIQDFFIQNGYSADKINQALNSPKVEEKVKQADKLEQTYEINQSPTIIINGATNSYKLIPGKNGKDIKDFFNIINYLIAKDLKPISR